MHDLASHSHHAHTHDVTLAPSLLRFSAAQRLAIAAVLAAFLWAVIFWSLGEVVS